jgi:exodeoxyribonuclease V beta subunit
VKRWLESRITGFDYNRHFGGVIYLFLRGLRRGSNTGIFTARPEKKLIEELEGVFSV